MTSLTPLDLSAALKRAAVAFATNSGPVEGIHIPLHVAVALRWEYGTVIIDIGDARTARTIANRLGLTAEPQVTSTQHAWRGVHNDSPTIVIGRGVLTGTPDDDRRAELATARRRRDLTAGALPVIPVTRVDVTA